MNPIRKIRWMIGLGVIVYLIVNGIREGAHESANGNSKDNIRHAQDIIRMWKDGFDVAHRPNLMPGRARQLLDGVLASRAEAPLKAEARKALAELDEKPHYFAFAERSAAFLPKINDYTSIEALAPPDPPTGSDSPPGLAPGRKLIVLMKGRPGSNDDDVEKEPPPFFDAGLIEACGDRIALSPDEVGAVVSVAWDRVVIGTYQQTGFVLPNGQEFKFGGVGPNGRPNPQPFDVGSAYRHSCDVIVREFPGGRPVAMKLLVADDPARRTSGRGAKLNPSGEEQVRRQLEEYLRSIVSGPSK